MRRPPRRPGAPGSNNSQKNCPEERKALTQHKPPGRIHGRVVDGAGRPVPKASVRVRDDMAVVDLQTTNVSGAFTSRLLFAGRYRVEAQLGDRLGAVDGVEVELGETTAVTVKINQTAGLRTAPVAGPPRGRPPR